MDWRDAAFAIVGGLGGFVGGLVTSIMKAVFPSYLELSKENRDLRAECESLRDELRAMEDTLRDEEETSTRR